MKKLINSFKDYAHSVTHEIELVALIRPLMLFFVGIAVVIAIAIQIILYPLLILVIIARNMLRPRHYFCQKWLLTITRYSIGLLALPTMIAGELLGLLFDG